MTPKHPGKVYAASVLTAVLEVGGSAVGGSYFLVFSLLLASIIALTTLVFIAALFGRTLLSGRAFQLICLILNRPIDAIALPIANNHRRHAG